MQKNDRVMLEISGLTAEGAGVGRCDGIAVFVPFTAVGDRIVAHILKVHKNYAFGKLERVVEPSPDRIQEDCDAFGRCGGCAFRHLSYAAEQEAKRQRVEDALRRIGGVEISVPPVLAAPQISNYRNKAQYPVRRENGVLQIGFFAPRSHRIVSCTDCQLQPPEFRAAVETVADWMESFGVSAYDEMRHGGLVRHIYLRKAEMTGQIMVCLVINGDTIPAENELRQQLRERVPGLQSVVLNINRERTNVILGERCRTLWGTPVIFDRLCGLEVSISPLSFYQVNRSQCEVLYRKAAEFAELTGTETVLDLYCGTGTVGLSMAANAGKVIGVEVVPQAVEDAKKNAERNGLLRAEFFCADAAQAAERLAREGVHPDVVLLDPPRKGCGDGLIETIAGMNPERVVYISCDPATLARDISRFRESEFELQKVQPVDLFPRTAHVETVALLSNQKPR